MPTKTKKKKRDRPVVSITVDADALAYFDKMAAAWRTTRSAAIARIGREHQEQIGLLR